MEYNELTDEQKTRAKECKTPEELMALAKSEGVELTDEQLEAVSGGWFTIGSGECDDYGCHTMDYMHG